MMSHIYSHCRTEGKWLNGVNLQVRTSKGGNQKEDERRSLNINPRCNVNPVGFLGTCKLSILDENPLCLLKMAVIVLQAQQGGHQRIVRLPISRLQIYSRETVSLTHFLTIETSKKKTSSEMLKTLPRKVLNTFNKDIFPTFRYM